MVQESKKAVPSWAHKEAACIASQLSSAVSLEPSLNSNTQALNQYWFSDSSQKSGAIATFWFLNSVTEWSQNLNFLHAVKTFWVKNLFASKQVSAWCADIEFPNLVAAYEKKKKDIGFHLMRKRLLFPVFSSGKRLQLWTAITSSAFSDFEVLKPIKTEAKWIKKWIIQDFLLLATKMYSKRDIRRRGVVDILPQPKTKLLYSRWKRGLMSQLTNFVCQLFHYLIS